MSYGTDRAVCSNCAELLPRAAAGRCPICKATIDRPEEAVPACHQCGATRARIWAGGCAFCQTAGLSHPVSDKGTGIRS